MKQFHPTNPGGIKGGLLEFIGEEGSSDPYRLSGDYTEIWLTPEQMAWLAERVLKAYVSFSEKNFGYHSPTFYSKKCPGRELYVFAGTTWIELTRNGEALSNGFFHMCPDSALALHAWWFNVGLKEEEVWRAGHTERGVHP